jgi:hypothetical protein
MLLLQVWGKGVLLQVLLLVVTVLLLLLLCLALL